MKNLKILASASLVALATATGASAEHTGPTVSAQLPLDVLCRPQSNQQPFNFTNCQTPVIGQATNTVVVPITRNPQTGVATGTFNVAFDGTLQIDGDKLQFNNQNGASAFVGRETFAGTNVELAANYDVNIVTPNGTASTISSFTVNSSTVRAINVNISDGLDLGFDGEDGGNFSVKAIDPTNIVDGNSVALSGSFSLLPDEDARAITFGKLDGTATLKSAPGPIDLCPNCFLGSPGAKYLSPFGLEIAVTPTITTKLDENGLRTLSVDADEVHADHIHGDEVVSNVVDTLEVYTDFLDVYKGTDMHGTRITNLADGVDAQDAVTFKQLQSIINTGKNGEQVTIGASTAEGKAVAIGDQNQASGDGAVAIGDPNLATGIGAVAIGADNTATGNGAVALGNLSTATGDGAIALGNFARANAANNVAIGNVSIASGTSSTALGGQSAAAGSGSTAVGVRSVAQGGGSVAMGFDSAATGEFALATGFLSRASALTATAVGNQAAATDEDAVAVGDKAIASGFHATAVGGEAVASGRGAQTFGWQAQSTGPLSAALGHQANAAGERALAVGKSANASALTSTAVGNLAVASDEDAVAVGDAARASGFHATAVGGEAIASGRGAQAFGWQSSATGNLSLAAGHQAKAGGINATAVGKNANAAFDASTAIGFAATTTRANQVILGGATSSVTIGDIAASTAAQVGATDILTVDASGTVGRDATIRPALAALTTANSAQDGRLTAVETLNTAQNGRLGALEAGQATLNDLVTRDRRDSRRGVAAAVALAQPAMPSEAGKTSYTANVSTFRGEQGFGAALAHRFDGANPIALTFGISHAGGKNTAGRVGLAGEF